MTGRYEDRIVRLIDHILANPAGDLSLDALADVAAMSRFHWHRVFRAMTGETLAQAVRRIRMQRASYLLVMTDQPLPAIATSVGMDNLTSFTRFLCQQQALIQIYEDFCLEDHTDCAHCLFPEQLGRWAPETSPSP